MERLIAASPMSAMGPDRVKTRSELLYRRAEHNFSRFFAVRAATGLEIQVRLKRRGVFTQSGSNSRQRPPEIHAAGLVRDTSPSGHGE